MADQAVTWSTWWNWLTRLAAGRRRAGAARDGYRHIASRTAAATALAYRSGEASPVDVTECLLDRIVKAKDDNIFITVMADRAREEARKADARYRRSEPLSPVDGVPIGWKDIFDVAGAPTTAGRSC